MCLEGIKRIYKGGGTRVKTGYKWMACGSRRGEYESPCMEHTYELGVWNEATGRRIMSEIEKDYPAGFHIFPTRADAKAHWLNNGEFVLVEVEYKGVIVKGNELNDLWDKGFSDSQNVRMDVVVAKHMKLIRKVR